MSLLSLPSDPGYLSDSGELNVEELTEPKYPHTRAQLSSLARQYRQPDNVDSDIEQDDIPRVPTSFVKRVVAMLVDEREDELKMLLQSAFGLDHDTAEQSVLDLMHKHRDDAAGVPFLFLTPTRRPISRPSSRASNRLIPARPDTPNSAPGSPLSHVFRRPHTPSLGSPLATGQPSSYMSVGRAGSDYSPTSSPVLNYHPPTIYTQQFTASLPASPLSSPRLLNAKANEFKPIPRPLSAAGHIRDRAETASPDLWAHSPTRATSNLAIAAPLLPEQSLLTRAATPNSGLRTFIRPDERDSDEEDPFDPFQKQPLHHQLQQQLPSFPTYSEYDSQWSNSSMSISPEDSQYQFYNSYSSYDSLVSDEMPPTEEEVAAAALTDGMTPFDVLSSVFGSSLAPSELEEALAENAYDFDRAMAWLVDRAMPTIPAGQPRTQSLGSRITVVSRDNGLRGGRGSPAAARFPTNGGRPGPQTANRVCRYFVAGECLRADCRFSHDLERALCRFWLRGTCAKNETCEFMHHLPEGADIASLNLAMSRANVAPGTGPFASQTAQQLDDFPALGQEPGRMNKRGAYSQPYDPSRTRFAAAVKKSGPPPSHAELAARRQAMGNLADSLHHRSAIVAPRASPRIKLHPPTLLPTLPTGESINALYMTYRSRALQLGAARNACLSRAADAWRRGDGAAAKRFSREGHELNTKMRSEMSNAAENLVRERANLAEQAVRVRDLNWSDDPGDRAARGRTLGGGFGVCLGIARIDSGDGKATQEERTEAMLDLHGLHSNEATEVLETFLLSLEHDHFYGLAYAVVGEEKHTGTQDPGRGSSRSRLATGVREWLHRWGYPWSERDGIICIDPLTHSSE
ncbi:hypothetical protein CYLTODRAFT_420941 [Cylindrobasidium torrendii FP15055 ss-10]|uniref:C3H1-type domain-containing protein n=1 Tax=Cylindrobasidium torrendii FP15055 ss-10 TaxID=1314674 RepID=A0A0D7BHW8_9AGAR|nr:hypothetical protein CYLTODRAFT_420941 [Cylindrobasidium torrendii FP15055 ss-10]